MQDIDAEAGDDGSDVDMDAPLTKLGLKKKDKKKRKSDDMDVDEADESPEPETKKVKLSKEEKKELKKAKKEAAKAKAAVCPFSLRIITFLEQGSDRLLCRTETNLRRKRRRKRRRKKRKRRAKTSYSSLCRVLYYCSRCCIDRNLSSCLDCRIQFQATNCSMRTRSISRLLRVETL